MTLLAEHPAHGKAVAGPGHGSTFTDHMITAQWAGGHWCRPALGPLRHLSIHPGMIGLHYAQVIFEGMKAFVQEDGSIAVFRPDPNAVRFARSASRLAMPPLPADMFLASIDMLVRADAQWLTDNPRHALYLRPLMFGSEANLMLRESTEFTYLLMAFLAGGFFGETVEPVASGMAGRDQAPLDRGNVGDGPLLRRRRPDHHTVPDRNAAARSDPRLAAHAGRPRGFRGKRGAGVRRRMARRMPVRLDHRDVRLRHRGRGDTGRPGARRGRRLCHRHWRDGPGNHRLRAALLDVQHGRGTDPGHWLHRVCRGATGRWLPWLRLATAVTLADAAVGALAAGAAAEQLSGGTLGIARNVAGVTGIGLLTATVIGGQLAWIAANEWLLPHL